MMPDAHIVPELRTDSSTDRSDDTNKSGDTFSTHNDRDGRPKGKGRVVTNPTANLAGAKESSPTLSAEDRLQTTNEGKAHPQDTFSARFCPCPCTSCKDQRRGSRLALTAVLDEIELMQKECSPLSDEVFALGELKLKIQKWLEECK